jgi:transcriptional regulator with XRE-family HTH domain
MSGVATLVRGARVAAGLTQREIAARSGILQPNVARAEAGGRALSIETCTRLLRAAGYRLAVFPGRGTDVFETGAALVEAVLSGNEDRAYRLVIQLADDLEDLHGAERVAATVAPPAPSGDQRFDAFLAGVVETRLDAERLPHPRWLADAPNLATPWFVDPWTAGSDRVVAATPPALRRRGVVIDAAELVST